MFLNNSEKLEIIMEIERIFNEEVKWTQEYEFSTKNFKLLRSVNGISNYQVEFFFMNGEKVRILLTVSEGLVIVLMDNLAHLRKEIQRGVKNVLYR